MKNLLKPRGSSPGTARSAMPGNSFSISSGGVPLVVHTPEKSGLPLARGVGAERFGFPSFVRGIPAAGWLIHCACAVATAAAQKTAIAACRRSIGPLYSPLRECVLVVNRIAVLAAQSAARYWQSAEG